MKVKLNFSGAAITGFFVNNGEKIVLGVMVFVLLCFLYGAITARPLDDSKSPEAIVHESEQAKTRINAVDFKESGETVSAVDFQKLIAEDRKEVPIAKLRQAGEWNPRLFPELTKRGDPEIYPVGELQIASGYALIPYLRNDASGHAAAASGQGAKVPTNAAVPGVRAPGAETKAAYYVILTGIVPVEKEEQEYRRRFEYAVKPNLGSGSAASQPSHLDVPQYFFFQAERAEVTDAKEEAKWTELDWLARVPDVLDSGKKDAEKWAASYGEIVDPTYVFSSTTPANSSVRFFVTWPLPPVYLKSWGLEAGHPKVPLLNTHAASEQPEQPTDNQTPANPFGFPGVGGGAPGPAAGQGQPHKTPGPVAGAPKRGPGPAHPGAIAQPDTGAATANTAPYRLFRFVDLTAEKGKTYRYRVRLIVANPNFGLKAEDLEKPESTKSEWRLSPWSDPSPAVTVPTEARILADSLMVRSAADPQGKIYLLSLLKDEKTGDWVEAAKDFDVPLGGYASFPSTKIDNVADMSAEEVRSITAPPLSADQAMLLDVRNDEALGASKSKGPTEMVFIDSTGRIKLYNSAADGLILKDYQQRTTVPAEATATPK